VCSPVYSQVYSRVYSPLYKDRVQLSMWASESGDGGL
jgi:hypothetical protein